MWVAGGEGGNPPATGASLGRGGERREPRGGRLAAAGSREGEGRGGGVLQAGVPPPLPPPRRLSSRGRGAAGRWLFPSAGCGGRSRRGPPPRPPPKIPLLKEPRGPARLKPVAAPWQEEPLTLPETHSRGGSRWRPRSGQSTLPTQPAGGGAANPRAASMGSGVGREGGRGGRASERAALRGVGWGGGAGYKGRGRAPRTRGGWPRGGRAAR